MFFYLLYSVVELPSDRIEARKVRSYFEMFRPMASLSSCCGSISIFSFVVYAYCEHYKFYEFLIHFNLL